MQGDFSRLTFDPRKHYRSVLMQQGRVQLDADWNEQIDIFYHALETQLRDLLGSSGAPEAYAGFEISVVHDDEETTTSQQQEDPQRNRHTIDLRIGSGRYYVEGILCENEQELPFTAQPDYPHPERPSLPGHTAIAYLDVWSRHITAFEDPSLREVALGNIDTTTRVKTIWQVKLLPIDDDELQKQADSVTHQDIVSLPAWDDLLNRARQKGQMSARHHLRTTLDNHLYRVEIHHVRDKKVTFKWSRENASVVFALDAITGSENADGTVQYIATLSDQLRDKTQLRRGDWVEFVSNQAILAGRTLPLYQVTDLPDFTSQQVTLVGRRSTQVEALLKQSGSPLLLRRWDYDVNRNTQSEDGTFQLHEGEWLDLERGIQVRFTPGGTYAVGDYWLIPSRAVGSTIEWPSGEQGPLALPPRGIYHQYCPLALLHLHHHRWHARDVRRRFAPLPVLTAREEVPHPSPRQHSSLIERCTSNEESLAGNDVVSFVPNTERGVHKAHEKNEHLLFGVVSGEETREGERFFDVTTYGRARCKVIGPVEAGDLLTVSHRGGHARAVSSEYRASHHGSILGKALGTHRPDEEDDTAIIDIMVTLQ